MPKRVASAGVAALCAAVVVFAIAALLVQASAAAVVLPIGPAGTAIRLAIDPLAASFLVLLFAILPCGETTPLQLAAIGLCLLAGDRFTLALGVLLLGGRAGLRVSATATVCLIAALALAGASGDFAILRASPPEGWRAASVFWLTLAGAGAASRLNPPIALYLILRVLFDLCGASQPVWWGAPLLLAGAAIAAFCSLRAALATTLHACLSSASSIQLGFAVMALGLALMARAVDLPSVASMALASAWLGLACHVLCRTLLLLIADTVEAAAGTRRLDRLGWLIHAMPITTASCMAGLLAVAALPPGLGFAAFWLLFQSVLAIARISQPGVQVLILLAALAVAGAVGMIALAMVRLLGTAFLGRPRTPRAAVAEEVPGPRRLVILALASLAVLLGVCPALALLPAVAWTRFAGLSLLLQTGAEAPGYSPIATAALLALLGIAIWRIRRPAGEQRQPVWSGGYAAPPSWLPLGDPATQYGPASFTEPLQDTCAAASAIGAVWRRTGRYSCWIARLAARALIP